MKILLAEDDTLTRFMMSEMLDELECDFDVCGNGDEAVSMIAADPSAYAMVLMDIHMPVVTGIDAMRAIRSAESDPPKQIPIIAITADHHWQNAKRCQDIGFDSVISKPVSLKKLEEFISEIRSDSHS